MSLRARLVAIVLVMVAGGLAAAGFATYHYLQSFLLDRVDEQLAAAARPAARELSGPPDDERGPGPEGGIVTSVLPVGSVAQLRTTDGRVASAFFVRQRGSTAPIPRLPAEVPAGESTADLPKVGDYRILSTDAAGVDPHLRGTLIVAMPLTDVNDTLHQVVWIELAVGAATLAALAALGFWLVRLGLRPLVRIEQTAGAIAAGDLSRRVEDANPRTEVGRLGRALNAMLAHIEAAFAERRAAEERLRRFVGDASHELQTPLTSVRGYAELFRRGAAERPEDLQTVMRRIEAEATRMGLLVDDLLLLARLDQRRPLARERLDLVPLVGDLVGDARAVEPDRPIEMAANGPVVVSGDEMRLRQVVANLLSNARVHTPAGAPVSVRVGRDGERAIIEVRDRGPGMVPEHAARAFERFFRADPSRARASGGSGLGLSIVAAIAEAHGGRAEVDSTPGEGTTFRVILPLDEGSGPAEPTDLQGAS